MKIDKLNLDGKKSSMEVLDKIFSAKINHKLVSNVLYKTNANYKGRHAKTKQQNEVSGPTSKIYAQKGTGNARHASRKAPIFVGGGIAHGPKGQLSYKKRKLNKSEKKQSIASLISEKNKNNQLLVLSDFKNEITKLIKFLNLNFEDNIYNYQKTAKQREKINTPSYDQVVQPLYTSSIHRYKNFEEIKKIETDIRFWINKFSY